MVRAEPASAAEQLDSGNVGAWREFGMPTDATVSEIYAQYAIPAAIHCAREILTRMADDPGYVGAPLVTHGVAARGRYRPVLGQDRLAFSWDDDPETILRRVHAATFGVRTTLGDQRSTRSTPMPTTRTEPTFGPARSPPTEMVPCSSAQAMAKASG
jgi:hypothetical protein